MPDPDDQMQLFHQMIAALEKHPPKVARAKNVIRGLADAVHEAGNKDLSHVLVDIGNDLNDTNVPATLIVLHDMTFDIETTLNQSRSPPPPSMPPAIRMAPTPRINTAPSGTPEAVTPRPAPIAPDQTFPFLKPQHAAPPAPVIASAPTPAIAAPTTMSQVPPPARTPVGVPPSAVPTQPPVPNRATPTPPKTPPANKGNVAFVVEKTPASPITAPAQGNDDHSRLLRGSLFGAVPLLILLAFASIVLVCLSIVSVEYYNDASEDSTSDVTPAPEPRAQDTPDTSFPIAIVPVAPDDIDATHDSAEDTDSIEEVVATTPPAPAVEDTTAVEDPLSDVIIREVEILSGPDKGKTMRLIPVQ